MRIFGREPTLWLQALAAVLGLLVTFGLTGLSAEQAAFWVAVVTAVVTAINAALVRPIAPIAFTGLVAAVATLAAAYGFAASQEQVGMVQGIVISVLALLARHQVTPAQDVAMPVAEPLPYR
jgi:ABC-type enterochelin transport system permease subunit